jgi:capsular exopolysaccharide synthesis family protein
LSILPFLSATPSEAAGPAAVDKKISTGATTGHRLDERLATFLAPTSFAAEQYRVLRHQVQQLRGKEGLVVAVTSPAVGEGKTTTAVNLAGALAQASGARVLLIDADLRRPAVSTWLGFSEARGGPGLAGALLDPGFELGVLIRQRSPFNLSVIPAGRPVDNPYELLLSARFGELLAAARSSHDFVVVDTPPVLLVPDCRALAQWVDTFLLVVAAHKTPRKLLEEALNAMDPAKLAGIVFNQDDRPLSGHYRQYAQYYPRPDARETPRTAPSASGSDGRSVSWR